MAPAHPPAGGRYAQHIPEGIERSLLVEVEQIILSGNPSRWIDSLRRLVEYFKARGGLVGYVDRDSCRGAQPAPNILFSYGAVEKTRYKQEVTEFFTRHFTGGADAPDCVTGVIGPAPLFACCSLRHERRAVLGIVLWGDAGARFDDLTLLRAFAPLALEHLLDCERRKPYGQVSCGNKPLPPGYVAGVSRAMAAVDREVAMLGETDWTVCIRGETGVGKEYVARLIHAWSRRCDHPFVAVNCAAIPADLLESEMFGIGKGVASGVHERDGYFQLAKGGTLFLDEIGEMAPQLQAKLLRALQDKELRRVGGAPYRIDVRVVAATNADLGSRIRAGAFRADLFYRLAEFQILVPPLRERREDVTVFIDHFLNRTAAGLGKRIHGLTLDALELLHAYPWPGNIRELAHEIRRLVYLCPDGQAIGKELLSPHILSASGHEPGPHEPGPRPLRLRAEVERLERRMILDALARARGVQARAARLLGISRNGLAIKMHRLGIKEGQPGDAAAPPEG